MIFIGERINTGFRDIKQAVLDKDPEPLRKWARRQTEAGASYLDVNLGAVSGKPEDMCWMIETVQETVDTPICIDTNKPKILAEAIKVCKKPALINSTTAADEKLDAILPVAVEYNAAFIGVVMDEKGTPKNADKRVENAGKILAKAMELGIPTDSVFLDPDTGSHQTVHPLLRPAAPYRLRPVQYLQRNRPQETHQPHIPGHGHQQRHGRRHLRCHGPEPRQRRPHRRTHHEPGDIRRLLRGQMKLLILHSRRPRREDGAKDPYIQTFNARYAERVIGNIEGRADFCGACGAACTACRRAYGRRYADRLAGVIAFPGALPYVLERPADLLPEAVPAHDVLLALHIHEQVLLECLARARDWGTRALVAPLEASDWVSAATRRQAHALGRDLGVEVAFPKPFCAFDPPEGSLLARFRREFHIGRPEVRIEVRGGRIERAFVEVSAACGATYYVARGLEGRRVDEDLRHEVVAKRLHAYPCTASMAWDEALGDTVLHVAGEAHYDILRPLGHAASARPETVRTPLGRVIRAPAGGREGVESIERAKRDILRQLHLRGAVSLEDLRRQPRSTPAAVHAALLLLKQEGRIRTEGHTILGR